MPVGPRADTGYMSQLFETPQIPALQDRRRLPMSPAAASPGSASQCASASLTLGSAREMTIIRAFVNRQRRLHVEPSSPVSSEPVRTPGTRFESGVKRFFACIDEISWSS
jgi:hypothetical protein